MKFNFLYLEAKFIKISNKQLFKFLCFLFFTLIFTTSQAQNSMVGDGFGGRLWYKPYNYTVGSYSGHTVCGPERSLYSWGSGPMGDTTFNPPPLNGIHKAIGLDSVSFYTTGYNMAAIRSDKSGWYWDGYIYNYALLPKKVIDDVVFADAGIDKVSYVKSDSTVWSLGYNFYGEFGNNASNYNYDSIPLKMVGVNDAVRVAISSNSILVLHANGTVTTTGVRNNDFFINNNIDSIYSIVPNLADIVDIKAVSGSYAALDKNGNVWTWGNGFFGALGLGYDSTLITPQKISNLQNIIAISGSCDGFHFLALDKDSNCFAWGGFNSYGTLGNNAMQDVYVPVMVQSGVADIMAGETFSYLVKTDGSLWCTGSSNTFGSSIWLNLPDTSRYVFTKLDPTIAPFNLCSPEHMVNSNFNISNNNLCVGTCINYSPKNNLSTNTYQWFFEGGTPSNFNGAIPPDICYNNVGAFNTILIVSDGIKIDSSKQIITVLSKPIAAISGPDTICIGQTVSLNSINTALSYLWNTGANTQNISVAPSQSTTYTLVLANSTCKDSAVKTISVVPYPNAAIVGDNYFSCDEEFVTLSSKNTAINYLWSNGATTANTQVSPVSFTVYTLTLLNAQCIDTASFVVDIEPNCDLIFPNTFTPNNDGLNDGFNAVNWQKFNLEFYNLSIFNRFGEKIYDSKIASEAWPAKDCDMGTYYYLCHYNTIGRKRQKLFGDISLIK